MPMQQIIIKIFIITCIMFSSYLGFSQVDTIYWDFSKLDSINTLFENDIEEPEWFQKHQEEQQGEKRTGQGKKGFGNKTELTLKEKGQKLALNTKKVLGKNLMTAINSKGSAYAVGFCNISANKLIDSMATELNAKINFTRCSCSFYGSI